MVRTDRRRARAASTTWVDRLAGTRQTGQQPATTLPSNQTATTNRCAGHRPRNRQVRRMALQAYSAVIDVTFVFLLYRSVILWISQRSIFSQVRSSSSPYPTQWIFMS